MAQRKGFIYRMMMGRDDNPDFTEARLPGTRWQVFKDIITMRFGALVKINLLMLLFALPAIAWIWLSFWMNSQQLAALPFSSNAGVGYPFFDDIVMQGNYLTFWNNITFVLILIPALLIAAIGFAGGFHVIKLLVWGEGIAVAQHFFKGIKSNILQFMLGMLIAGIAIGLVVLNTSIQPISQLKPFWSVMSQVSIILLLVLTLFFTMFFLTQAETYKLKLWPLIKNSFIFGIGMFAQNIFFMLISVLPFVLLLFLGGNPIITMLVIVLLAFFAFSYLALIWTIYTQYVFDKYINENVEGAIKDRGIYRRKKDSEDASAKRMKAANIRRVTSIDEGKTFTPLSEGYSRNDLRRMLREKEQVKTEIEQEIEEVRKFTDEYMDADDKGKGNGE